MEYPVLEYILNELSIQGVYAETKQQAREWMEVFIKTCQAVREIGFHRLRFASKSIKSIALMSDYTIEIWLKDEEVKSDLKDIFRRNLNDIGSPYLEVKDTNFFLECNGKREEAKGLGSAYMKNTIAVSFSTNVFWNTNMLNLLVLFGNGEQSIIFDRHISNQAQITKHKRIFENNQKHGWCGRGHQKNQSRMLCCEQEHAEFLLRTAVIQPNKPSNLCNYDIINDKFIEFFPHEPNKYHGFHYEDNLGINNRQLNNTNGIPISTQVFLKKLHELY